MVTVSRRGDAISAFLVMDVMEAAATLEREGRQVFHLEVGQPSTPAPQLVREAAARALEADRLGYTVAQGIPALRARIARHYADTHGVTVDPARIFATTGSSGAFLLAFLAAFDPGARVAIADPGYPCYRNILSSLGIEVVSVPCGPDSHYQLTAEMVAALPAIQGVIVASPSNPTGSIIDAPAMQALADLCDARGIHLISDEIYHGLQYAAPAVTAAAFSDRAIIINSFSKYFSMTGWRIGWMIVPEGLIRTVEKLAQNYFISAPTLAQHAAIAAFDATEELDGHVARYRRNRDIILNALPAMGITQMAPADGAFYVYADISHLSDDSTAFCARLLAETGVAITPGTDFDPGRGHRMVRLSYAGDTAMIAEAMQRLAIHVAGLTSR